jgi:hypothetical protein
LTPAGKAAFSEILDPFAGINAKLDSQINEQEMDALSHALARIVKTF